jgi:hypothetical protein
MAIVREFEAPSLADRPLKISGISIPDNVTYDLSPPSLKISYEEKKPRGKKATLTKIGEDLITVKLTFTAHDISSYTALEPVIRAFVQRARKSSVLTLKHWSLDPYSIYDFIVDTMEGPDGDKDGISKFTVNLKEYNPATTQKLDIKKPEIDLKKQQIEFSGVAGMPPDVIAPPAQKMVSGKGKDNLALRQ